MKLWNRVFQGAVLLGGVVALPSMAWELKDGDPVHIKATGPGAQSEGWTTLTAIESQDPGPASRAVLGISTEEVSPALASHVHLDRGMGVLITHVTPGGAAEGAGILTHDIIFKMGGFEVEGLESLRQQLGSMAGGEQVLIGVIRRGAALEFPVTLGSGSVLVHDPVLDTQEASLASTEAQVLEMAAQIDALSQALALYKPNHAKYQVLTEELDGAQTRYADLQARAQALEAEMNQIERQRWNDQVDRQRSADQADSLADRIAEVNQQRDARVAYQQRAERLMRDSQLSHAEVLEELALPDEEGWNRIVLERSLSERTRRVDELSSQVAEAEARIAMMRELEAQQGLAAQERMEAERRLVQLHESLAERSNEQAAMEARLAAERDRAELLTRELARVEARVEQESAARRSLEAKAEAMARWQETMDSLAIERAEAGETQEAREADLAAAMEAMKLYQERAELERRTAEEMRLEAEQRAMTAESARRDAERRALEAALEAQRIHQDDHQREIEDMRRQMEAALDAARRQAAEGGVRSGASNSAGGASGVTDPRVRGELREIRERLDRIEEMLERALGGGEVVVAD